MRSKSAALDLLDQALALAPDYVEAGTAAPTLHYQMGNFASRCPT